MKIKSLATISVVGITAFFTSCKHADKSGILAPKDVAMLLHIDGASLSSKLSWQEIKETSWFKEVYSSAKDSLHKKLMDNPENAGIDGKSNFAFFYKKQGPGNYVAFEGALKDTAAFIAFNKDVMKEGAITRDGDVSHMTMNSASLSWNESRFIYLYPTPSINLTDVLHLNLGNNASHEEPYTFSTDSLNKFGKEILDISSDNNLAGDDRFATMMGQTGDMHFWINNEQYFNSFIGGALSMMKLDVLFQGNASATTFNFDNGKMTIKGKQYYNKDLAKLKEQYPAHPIGADVINRIPSKNVAMALVFNYPPAGLKELLKLIGVDGIVNGTLAKIDYSMDEFVKANKGDVVFAVSDLGIRTKEIPIPGYNGQPSTSYKSTTPDAKLLFATSVNDKAAFDKLITSVKGVVAQYMPNGIPDATYTLNNNWFVAGNSQDDVNKFAAGGNNSQPFTDKIAGHAFGGYIDLQKIIGMANETASTDSSAKAAVDLSLKTWQDVVMYGDAGTGSYFEVNLVDKSTNSLKQLNQYVDKMAAIIKAKNKDVMLEEIPRNQLDTAMAMPADSIVAPNH